MTLTVAVLGIIVLFYLAVLIGMELDTGMQRRERQRLAKERDELARALAVVDKSKLCRHCPLWKFL